MLSASQWSLVTFRCHSLSISLFWSVSSLWYSFVLRLFHLVFFFFCSVLRFPTVFFFFVCLFVFLPRFGIFVYRTSYVFVSRFYTFCTYDFWFFFFPGGFSTTTYVLLIVIFLHSGLLRFVCLFCIRFVLLHSIGDSVFDLIRFHWFWFRSGPYVRSVVRFVCTAPLRIRCSFASTSPVFFFSHPRFFFLRCVCFCVCSVRLRSYDLPFAFHARSVLRSLNSRFTRLVIYRYVSILSFSRSVSSLRSYFFALILIFLFIFAFVLLRCRYRLRWTFSGLIPFAIRFCVPDFFFFFFVTFVCSVYLIDPYTFDRCCCYVVLFRCLFIRCCCCPPFCSVLRPRSHHSFVLHSFLFSFLLVLHSFSFVCRFTFSLFVIRSGDFCCLIWSFCDLLFNFTCIVVLVLHLLPSYLSFLPIDLICSIVFCCCSFFFIHSAFYLVHFLPDHILFIYLFAFWCSRSPLPPFRYVVFFLFIHCSCCSIHFVFDPIFVFTLRFVYSILAHFYIHFGLFPWSFCSILFDVGGVVVSFYVFAFSLLLRCLILRCDRVFVVTCCTLHSFGRSCSRRFACVAFFFFLSYDHVHVSCCPHRSLFDFRCLLFPLPRCSLHLSTWFRFCISRLRCIPHSPPESRFLVLLRFYTLTFTPFVVYLLPDRFAFILPWFTFSFVLRSFPCSVCGYVALFRFRCCFGAFVVFVRFCVVVRSILTFGCLFFAVISGDSSFYDSFFLILFSTFIRIRSFVWSFSISSTHYTLRSDSTISVCVTFVHLPTIVWMRSFVSFCVLPRYIFFFLRCRSSFSLFVVAFTVFSPLHLIPTWFVDFRWFSFGPSWSLLRSLRCDFTVRCSFALHVTHTRLIPRLPRIPYLYVFVLRCFVLFDLIHSRCYDPFVLFCFVCVTFCWVHSIPPFLLVLISHVCFFFFHSVFVFWLPCVTLRSFTILILVLQVSFYYLSRSFWNIPRFFFSFFFLRSGLHVPHVVWFLPSPIHLPVGLILWFFFVRSFARAFLSTVCSLHVVGLVRSYVCLPSAVVATSLLDSTLPFAFRPYVFFFDFVLNSNLFFVIRCCFFFCFFAFWWSTFFFFFVFCSCLFVLVLSPVARFRFARFYLFVFFVTLEPFSRFQFAFFFSFVLHDFIRCNIVCVDFFFVLLFSSGARLIYRFRFCVDSYVRFTRFALSTISSVWSFCGRFSYRSFSLFVCTFSLFCFLFTVASYRSGPSFSL